MREEEGEEVAEAEEKEGMKDTMIILQQTEDKWTRV